MLEANTARFALAMATRDWRRLFVAGTDLPDRCHKRGCGECTAVRCAEVEEVGRAAGLTYKQILGSHDLQVGHNTGLRGVARWGVDMQQGCTPDEQVGCKRQADYHILVGCIGIVIEGTVRDYKVMDSRVRRPLDMGAGSQLEGL